MTEYLVPQADRITTVATVVDAIAAGCDTAASIAEGINMASRQGSYYPHAAAALGYVYADNSTIPATWHLTADGERFADGIPSERAADLVERLSSLEELDILTGPDGDDLLAEVIAERGYSPETTRRRVQTLRAWGEFLALGEYDQVTALADSMRETAEFAPAAASALREARKAQSAARAAAVGELCSTCFTTKPLTGVCDNCE